MKQYGIDGWRLDQAYQVPVPAWEEIRTAVEQAAADRAAGGETWGTLGYMVAEVWDGNQNNFVDKIYGTAAGPGLKSSFELPAALWFDAGDWFRDQCLQQWRCHLFVRQLE